MQVRMRWRLRSVMAASLLGLGACGGGGGSSDAGPSGSLSLAQEAFLKASNAGAVDEFGSCAALSGDTLVVGASQEDSSAQGINGNQADDSASFSGAAYVFVRTGTVWTQQAYLKGSNTAAGDLFGCSVALSGDTLVVGASAERSAATGVNGDQTQGGAYQSGAVYVFTRTGATWTQQAYLKASNSEFRDRFGTSVALSGDTLVVGATWEDGGTSGVDGDQADNSAPDSGATYVFTRTGSTWTQQAYLKASQAGAGDYFGQSLALAGDTLVVGASLEDSGATGVNGNQADNSADGSGAAYVFTRTGTTWAQQAYVKGSNTDAFDQFGISVALSGETLVVGARFEGSSATGVDGAQGQGGAEESGAAYVFTRSGTTWAQQAYLKASNTRADDRFGEAVALSGDTVLVGSVREQSVAPGVHGDQHACCGEQVGAAYLFTRSGTTWTQQAYLKAAVPGDYGWFGSAVAVSSNALVVGASGEGSSSTGVNGPQTGTGAAGSGAIYVFR